MSGRFVYDSKGKKVYIGREVIFNNKVWILEDIYYLSWSKEQYITLRDIKNSNKKIDYIKTNSILGV